MIKESLKEGYQAKLLGNFKPLSFDHSFCLFLVSEDPAPKLKNHRKLHYENRFLDPFQKSKINFKGIFGIYMASGF